MKQFLTTLSFSLLFAFGYSQAPAKMSYQSVIRNSTGSLVANSAVSVKISILQGSVSGAAVYTETHSVTSNSNGLVTLEIGGGTPVIGSMTGIVWSTGPYFVKTETDPAGGSNYTLASTSQLLSVPYALYAETSGSVGPWVNDANGIKYTAGNVGIGAPSKPSYKLYVMGETNGIGSNPAVIASNDTWHTAMSLKNNNTQYSFIVSGPNDIELQPNNFGIYNAVASKWSLTINGQSNNIGIGNTTAYPQPAKSRLHVFSGDVNIDQIGSGIIMKSANGQCWRVTVGDSGNLISTAIACPQ